MEPQDVVLGQHYRRRSDGLVVKVVGRLLNEAADHAIEIVTYTFKTGSGKRAVGLFIQEYDPHGPDTADKAPGEPGGQKASSGSESHINEVKVGSRYRHRKGHTYVVVGFCRLEWRPSEFGVLYRRDEGGGDADDGGAPWVRPMSEFCDGRFTEVAEPAGVLAFIDTQGRRVNLGDDVFDTVGRRAARLDCCDLKGNARIVYRDGSIVYAPIAQLAAVCGKTGRGVGA